jgi:hypothetical protein
MFCRRRIVRRCTKPGSREHSGARPPRQGSTWKCSNWQPGTRRSSHPAFLRPGRKRRSRATGVPAGTAPRERRPAGPGHTEAWRRTRHPQIRACRDATWSLHTTHWSAL